MWPLNDGQVYTTLARLERDALVAAEAEADGQRVYRLTGAGRAELDVWFSRAVSREAVPARSWPSSSSSPCARRRPRSTK